MIMGAFLNNSFMMDGGLSVRVKARWWRIRGQYTSQTDTSHWWWRVLEVEMYADFGSVDITAPAYATDFRAPTTSGNPQSGFDDTTSTLWDGQNNNGAWDFVPDCWLAQVFPSSVAVTTVKWWPLYNPGGYYHAAGAVAVDYSLDGVIWVQLQSINTEAYINSPNPVIHTDFNIA